MGDANSDGMNPVLEHLSHPTQPTNNVLFLVTNQFLETFLTILDKDATLLYILSVKMNTTKFMVLSDLLMALLKDGVLILPPVSTVIDMIAMAEVEHIFYVLLMIPVLKVSIGEDVLLVKTLKLQFLKILNELLTLLN